MYPNRTRQSRKLTLIAVGMALLVLVGWFLAARPQARAHGSGPAATVTAAMESGSSTEPTAPPRSRFREAQGNDEQIRRRVESMLNIKSNEIAIISVPKAALDQCLGQTGNPSMTDALSVMRGLLAKDALKGCLEGVLKEGGPVKVKVNDQNSTEYSGKDFQMKIEVAETTKGESNVLIQLTINGSKLINQMSIFPGFGLVYQFPTPAEEGIVILIGKDPSPTTTTTNPHSEQ